MLRVYLQGSTAILLGFDIVLYIIKVESSEGSVGVDYDEDLSKVRLTGELRCGLFFVDEIDA